MREDIGVRGSAASTAPLGRAHNTASARPQSTTITEIDFVVVDYSEKLREKARNLAEEDLKISALGIDTSSLDRKPGAVEKFPRVDRLLRRVKSIAQSWAHNTFEEAFRQLYINSRHKDLSQRLSHSGIDKSDAVNAYATLERFRSASLCSGLIDSSRGETLRKLYRGHAAYQAVEDSMRSFVKGEISAEEFIKRKNQSIKSLGHDLIDNTEEILITLEKARDAFLSGVGPAQPKLKLNLALGKARSAVVNNFHTSHTENLMCTLGTNALMPALAFGAIAGLASLATRGASGALTKALAFTGVGLAVGMGASLFVSYFRDKIKAKRILANQRYALTYGQTSKLENYDQISAIDLSKKIAEGINELNHNLPAFAEKALVDALVDYRARITAAKRSGNDFISYSSFETAETERLQLMRIYESGLDNLYRYYRRTRGVSGMELNPSEEKAFLAYFAHVGHESDELIRERKYFDQLAMENILKPLQSNWSKRLMASAFSAATGFGVGQLFGHLAPHLASLFHHSPPIPTPTPESESPTDFLRHLFTNTHSTNLDSVTHNPTPLDHTHITTTPNLRQITAQEAITHHAQSFGQPQLGARHFLNGPNSRRLRFGTFHDQNGAEHFALDARGMTPDGSGGEVDPTQAIKSGKVLVRVFEKGQRVFQGLMQDGRLVFDHNLASRTVIDPSTGLPTLPGMQVEMDILNPDGSVSVPASMAWSSN